MVLRRYLLLLTGSSRGTRMSWRWRRTTHCWWKCRRRICGVKPTTCAPDPEAFSLLSTQLKSPRTASLKVPSTSANAEWIWALITILCYLFLDYNIYTYIFPEVKSDWLDTFWVKFLGSVQVPYHKGNDVLCAAMQKVWYKYSIQWYKPSFQSQFLPLTLPDCLCWHTRGKEQH